MMNFLHCFRYGSWLMMMELEFETTITPTTMWEVTTPYEMFNAPITEELTIFDTRLLGQIFLSVIAITKTGETSETIQQSVSMLAVQESD